MSEENTTPNEASNDAENLVGEKERAVARAMAELIAAIAASGGKLPDLGEGIGKSDTDKSNPTESGKEAYKSEPPAMYQHYLDHMNELNKHYNDALREMSSFQGQRVNNSAQIIDEMTQKYREFFLKTAASFRR